MNEQDKQLIERYLYAVMRALPEKRRSDIELELKTLIDDEIEHSNKSVETVLMEMGDPKALAIAYTGKPRALIGSQLIDPYKKVLQVMMLVALITVTVALIFEGLTVDTITFGSFLNNLFETLFMVAVNTFAFVTIIFIAIEYFDASPEEDESSFSLKDLPELPTQNKTFSWVETVVSLVFIVVLFTLVNISPSLISIFSYSDGSWNNVALIDMSVFNRWVFVINIALAIAAFRQFIRFYFKTKTTAYITWNIPLLVLSVVLFIVIINQPGLINPELNTLLSVNDITTANIEQIVKFSLWVISGILVLTSGYEIYQDMRLLDQRYNKKN